MAEGRCEAAKSWQRDTEQWSEAAAQALVPGGHLVLVIGDGLVPSGAIDSARPSAEAAERAGLERLASASLERPDHGGRTHRREHVLAFRKPG